MMKIFEKRLHNNNNSQYLINISIFSLTNRRRWGHKNQIIASSQKVAEKIYYFAIDKI